jgi:integrase
MPDGRTLKKQSIKWYAVFCDFAGKLRRLPLFKDRRASDAMARIVDRLNSLRSSNDTLPPGLARAVDEMPSAMLASLAKWNIIPAEKATSTKLLSGHIEDWKSAILADGCTAEHAEKTTGRALRLIEASGAKQYSDLSAHDVLIALADLRKDRTLPDEKTEQGISPQTSNFYLGAVKQFATWMVRNKRATVSPLIDLDRLNVQTDRRHDRRALELDELHLLLDVTESGYSKPGPDGKPLVVVQAVDRYGMDGKSRALLYRLAVETGLRAGELRSLTRGSFQLDGDTPTVTIAAAYAKNRRQDVLPLKRNTAAALAVHLAGKMPTALAFTMPKSDRVGEMMQADLADARTAWIAAAGSHQERAERDGSTVSRLLR